MKITKDMPIVDILNLNPGIQKILADYGLHCIGCHVAAFESLEGGMKAHGMDDDDVELVVDEINKFLAENGVMEKKAIAISKTAVEELKKIIKANEANNIVRIKAEKSEGGFNYGFDLDEKINKTDIVIEAGDLKIVIGEADLIFIKGLAIDFADGQFTMEH